MISNFINFNLSINNNILSIISQVKYLKSDVHTILSLSSEDKNVVFGRKLAT